MGSLYHFRPGKASIWCKPVISLPYRKSSHKKLKMVRLIFALLCFLRLKRKTSQDHFAVPVAVAGDADDEGFREGSSVAVAPRD